MLTMSQHDWFAWHSPYDDPRSVLSRRLAMVRARLAEDLDGCRPGRVQVVSMCAGQGRDILGVLARHPRAGDVVARLVESDPHNVALARQGAAPFAGVESVEADAGCTWVAPRRAFPRLVVFVGHVGACGFRIVA